MGTRRRSDGIKGSVMAAVLCVSMVSMNFGAWAQSTSPVTSETETSETGASGEYRIEQVNLKAPEITAYVAGAAPEEIGQAEAYLSQEKLTLEGTPKRFSDSGVGIGYYILLDISGSIPSAYFAGMKDAVKTLGDHLQPQDHMVLYTFGDTVNQITDGTENPEERNALLDQLKNRDQETLLFEAIHQVASEISEKQDDQKLRNLLVVMTDGEDFALGKKQAEEALNNLKDTAIPAYAFGIRDTKKEYVNSFGEFARSSGGDMVVFSPEEGSQMLLGLQTALQDDISVSYKTASNVVTYKEEVFSLVLKDGKVVKRSVISDHWIPDQEAPGLVSESCTGQQQLRLVFSEPLKGLEEAANYNLTLDGEPVGVTGVSYDTDSRAEVNLTLAEPVKNGHYELHLIHITDVSMEENKIQGDNGQGMTSFDITDAPDQPVPPAPPKPFDYTGVLFLIFAAVVALVVALIVLSKKKKNAAAMPEASADKNPEHIKVADSGFRQHVELSNASAMKLTVLISMKGMQTPQTIWELGSSLIVGRSAMCDIHFEGDALMTRQHFALEREGNAVFIRDLETTNGTAVNGIRIQNRRKLESGDTIEAGSVKITVRW